MNYSIAVLPGDGIGPETVRETLRVLDATADAFGFSLTVQRYPFGGSSVNADLAHSADPSQHSLQTGHALKIVEQGMERCAVDGEWVGCLHGWVVHLLRQRDNALVTAD